MDEPISDPKQKNAPDSHRESHKIFFHDATLPASRAPEEEAPKFNLISPRIVPARSHSVA
jgi:hypothetical protein